MEDGGSVPQGAADVVGHHHHGHPLFFIEIAQGLVQVLGRRRVVCKVTASYDAPTDTAQFGVEGVAEEVTQVAPMPGAPVMEAIIAALS